MPNYSAEENWNEKSHAQICHITQAEEDWAEKYNVVSFESPAKKQRYHTCPENQLF